MSNNNEFDKAMDRKEHLGCLKVFGIILVTMIITVLVTLWVAKAYLFPSDFKPVALTDKEEVELSAKLDRLDRISGTDIAQKIGVSGEKGKPYSEKEEKYDSNEPLKPTPYSEEGAERKISFTQRELNAMIAKNTDLARKLAIDLSEDLVSARLLVPVYPDFPVLGGKTIRVQVGLALAYENNQPVVVLKGVKLMGVPIPNAWLGGIKNIDLVSEFGADEGFWKTFADGVESIKVEKGWLGIQFKE
ncbi:MAG: arginine N-succinyltransferase [Thermodesulfobacteriota bacterium]|nr:arginine N-succinyltransferase [Thermodesulfobacteriota bacterium]